MIFPTVLSKDKETRHVVKDQHTCLCGHKYNVFTTFTKNDFKKIQFRKNEVITCRACRSIIE